MIPRRGYYRFPWRVRAIQFALHLHQEGATYRAIAAALRSRRLVNQKVDPATIRRAIQRELGRSS